MLELTNVHAGYAGAEVLFGVDLTVAEGECITLLGRNGMGKTTTVKSIFGLLKPTQGTISFKKKPIHKAKPFKISRAGLGLVPEGRMIAPNLSVRENLIATARPKGQSGWNLDKIFEMFPNLYQRRNNFGNELSGGEQQLLAIGRALLTNPDLLVLDEATEGLAPLMRREVWRTIKVLRSMGQSILIIDKNVDVLNTLADRHYLLEKGHVVWTGSSAEFTSQRESLNEYLGLG